MKKISKVLSVILTLIMLLTAIPLTVSAATSVYSGTCGENLTWELDSDGVLTISGIGVMDDYDESTDIPWNEYRISVKRIVINDGATGIGSYAFAGCTSLEEITIPEGVTYISIYAFAYCTSLAQISIPESVTSIGAFVFYGCTSLEEITIPEGVTHINSHAFYYCTSLTQITIPESVTFIGNCAFYGCKALPQITISESVTYISTLAFYGCTSLTEIVVEEANPNYSSLDGVLYNKDKTSLRCYPAGKTETSFEIPESVTGIGSAAFYSCESLTAITIPENVRGIGSEAFRSCRSLTEITIPEGVTNIGEYTFLGCTSLTQITFLNPECEIYDESYTIDDGATIYGYEGSTAQAYAEKYNRVFVAITDECEHKYNAVVTAPTCTEQGYTTYTCECGDSYVADYVDVIEHKDNDGDEFCDYCDEFLGSEEEENKCSHMCHKSGFIGFIGKIINFFCKLFGINPVCECGVKHY